MVTYDAYDLAGLLFCVLLVLICAVVLYLTRSRPNRRAPHVPYREIGFTACKPQERR